MKISRDEVFTISATLRDMSSQLERIEKIVTEHFNRPTQAIPIRVVWPKEKIVIKSKRRKHGKKKSTSNTRKRSAKL
jgi:hypothetical protein